MASSNNPSGIWSQSYGYHKAIRIIFNIVIALYVYMGIVDAIFAITEPGHLDYDAADDFFLAGTVCAGITIISVIGLTRNKKFALWAYLIGCSATAIFNLVAFLNIIDPYGILNIERVLYFLGIVIVFSLAPTMYFIGRDILD